jgi:hypothetical protein
MRYVCLATAAYGSGRISFISGRLNTSNTGGTGLRPRLIRNLLEWTSNVGDEDWIEACHVPFETVDATIPAVDDAYNIGVERQNADFLSEFQNLREFDCVILAGYRNTLSPLVRSNLLSFVSGGGGLVLADVTQEGSLEIFSGTISFSVDSMNAVFAEGYNIWTEAGKAHSVFSSSLLGTVIPVLSSVSEDHLGSDWEVLNVFDTEATAGESNADIEEQIFLSSDDYAVPGEYFVGYYATVYEDGFITLKE